MSDDPFLEQQRQRLIESLRDEGIVDTAVLNAMAQLPRERFIADELRPLAYENRALRIDEGQTISQPYIVALMTQALQLDGTQRVLEIGTGSGYQAALLGLLAAEVFTIERIPALAESARRVLTGLGFHNIHFRVDDGSLGWPEQAPFDGIIVTACAPAVPDTLVEQLAESGRLVMPIGDESQTLYAFDKRRGQLHATFLCECRFVPLIGQAGFTE